MTKLIIFIIPVLLDNYIS